MPNEMMRLKTIEWGNVVTHRWSIDAASSQMDCPHGEESRAGITLVSCHDGRHDAKGKLAHCQSCGNYVCVFQIDDGDCLTFGFRTDRPSGVALAFANSRSMLAVRGFRTTEDDEQVQRLEELLAQLQVHTSGQAFSDLYLELRTLMETITADAALPMIRTCLGPLDETASGVQTTCLAYHVWLFYGLARLSREEAAGWVANWRQSPNEFIQTYIIENWDQVWSKPVGEQPKTSQQQEMVDGFARLLGRARIVDLGDSQD